MRTHVRSDRVGRGLGFRPTGSRRRATRVRVRIDVFGGAGGICYWGKQVVFEAAAKYFDVTQIQCADDFVKEGAFFLIWLD